MKPPGGRRVDAFDQFGRGNEEPCIHALHLRQQLVSLAQLPGRIGVPGIAARAWRARDQTNRLSDVSKVDAFQCRNASTFKGTSDEAAGNRSGAFNSAVGPSINSQPFPFLCRPAGWIKVVIRPSRNDKNCRRACGQCVQYHQMTCFQVRSAGFTWMLEGRHVCEESYTREQRSRDPQFV